MIAKTVHYRDGKWYPGGRGRYVRRYSNHREEARQKWKNKGEKITSESGRIYEYHERICATDDSKLTFLLSLFIPLLALVRDCSTLPVTEDFSDPNAWLLFFQNDEIYIITSFFWHLRCFYFPTRESEPMYTKLKLKLKGSEHGNIDSTRRHALISSPRALCRYYSYRRVVHEEQSGIGHNRTREPSMHRPFALIFLEHLESLPMLEKPI
ncbi:hypothetical protein KQX54_019241 [Cotesia glomerata]|uniref:Uncharacterized protein n=1 Tax=Cotesia glomerata TaxID=32391 RepID=A0AAV7IH93_COTGL|nr:hypothetical protein KQX54_019241 [Cotesia glomerata]